MNGAKEASVAERGQNRVKDIPQPTSSSRQTPEEAEITANLNSGGMSHLRTPSSPKPQSLRERGDVAGLSEARADEGQDMEIEHFQTIFQMGKGCRVRSSVANGLIYLDAK